MEEKRNEIMDEKLKEEMKAILDGLSDEQKEQAKNCKNMDDFMKLAGEWGIELPDEALDAVAGGGFMTHEDDPYDPWAWLKPWKWFG